MANAAVAGGQRIARPVLLWSCVLLAVLVMANAATIECLNVKAGGFLPRHEQHDAGHLTKWRVPAIHLVREHHIRTIARESGILVEQMVLTDAQEAAIDAEISRGRWNALLRNHVTRFGLLQYPAAGLLVVFGMAGVLNRTRGWRIRFCLACGIGITALGLAMFRGYFTSLGW